MKSPAEMYYAIKEAIQVMEHYDNGEDFPLVSSLRRLREIEKDGLTCSEGCDWPNCTRGECKCETTEKL